MDGPELDHPNREPRDVYSCGSALSPPEASRRMRLGSWLARWLLFLVRRREPKPADRPLVTQRMLDDIAEIRQLRDED